MTLNAWIDNKIQRFCCFYGYTRYCGDGVWYETCDFSNIYALLEAEKTCDIIIPGFFLSPVVLSAIYL